MTEPLLPAKRKADSEAGDPELALTVSKRHRPEDAQLSLFSAVGGSGAIIASGPPRTSDLQAPIMQLVGHQSEVFSLKFSPDGEFLASASFDKTIFLWNVWGECVNFGVLRGHKNAILDLQWSQDKTSLYSASADKSGAIWDVETKERLKRLVGHSQIVTSISPAKRGPPIVLTSSDDGTVKLWDSRMKGCQKTFPNKYPMLAVCLSDSYDSFFCGGLDNTIRYWDLRREQVVFSLEQHTDCVTGLALSHDGSFLLSNSMDCSLRMWDIRPFAPDNRCIKVFSGHEHNYEKNLLKCAWSADDSRVTAGSSDRFVYVWDVHRGQILYRLPGHHGSVNDVQFHPTQPVIASGGSDKMIFLGEIEKS